MGHDYYDYTENYNFSKELNKRKNYSNDGEIIGEVELGHDFYAELVKNGNISCVNDRITVWLCCRNHKEKIYAFTIMVGIGVCGRDTLLGNTVRMKFATNYAKLKEAYSRRYCNTKN